jgi:hypothetical protein
MNTNEERRFQFPADLIGDDGRLAIEFHAADQRRHHRRRDRVAPALREVDPVRVRLRARPAARPASSRRSSSSITLMASTFLSAPLSILLGILLYLVGSMYGYIRDGTREIDHSLAEIRLAKDKKARPPEQLPTGVLWFSNKLSKGVLYVVPDFAHFDYSVWLLQGHGRSPGASSPRRAGKALPPILVLMGLGTLLMIFKDFDR